MSAVPILDEHGKSVGTAELRPSIFEADVNGPLLHQAVVRELAGDRKGPGGRARGRFARRSGAVAGRSSARIRGTIPRRCRGRLGERRSGQP